MGQIADAFARLGDWLRARPHRLTVVNALLLTGILVMIGNGDLFRFVGGAAVALCTGVFAIRSVRQMERQRGALFPMTSRCFGRPTFGDLRGGTARPAAGRSGTGRRR